MFNPESGEAFGVGAKFSFGHTVDGLVSAMYV